MPARDILSKIAQDKRAESSLLDKGELSDQLYGGGNVTHGALVAEMWDTDPQGAFQNLQRIVSERLPFASEDERKRLRDVLKSKAPYPTFEEAVAALASGAFDPPEEQKSWWQKTPNELYPTSEAQAQAKSARRQQGGAKFKEYVRSVFSEEEINAALQQRKGAQQP